MTQIRSVLSPTKMDGHPTTGCNLHRVRLSTRDAACGRGEAHLRPRNYRGKIRNAICGIPKMRDIIGMKGGSYKFGPHSKKTLYSFSVILQIPGLYKWKSLDTRLLLTHNITTEPILMKLYLPPWRGG